MTVVYRHECCSQGMDPFVHHITAWDGGEQVGEFTVTEQERANLEVPYYGRVVDWEMRVEGERRKFHWDAAERVKRRTLNQWGQLALVDGFKAALLEMPDAGKDEDFER